MSLVFSRDRGGPAKIPRFDLSTAIEDLTARGASLVRGALGPPELLELQTEASRAPVVRWPEEIGRVRQRMEGCFLHPPYDGFPFIRGLADALARGARDLRLLGLRTWRPNEVSVQRYEPALVGIEPHRDNIRYRRLVAIVTTAGRARFRVLREREGGVIAEWEPEPGDLVLLRGPGLGGCRDGRPFHAVDAPVAGERWSVSFRMNTKREPQPFLE